MPGYFILRRPRPGTRPSGRQVAADSEVPSQQGPSCHGYVRRPSRRKSCSESRLRVLRFGVSRRRLGDSRAAAAGGRGRENTWRRRAAAGSYAGSAAGGEPAPSAAGLTVRAAWPSPRAVPTESRLHWQVCACSFRSFEPRAAVHAPRRHAGARTDSEAVSPSLL
jgi:hypothetical protein